MPASEPMQEPAPITSPLVLGARVTWVMFGPVSLLIVTAAIVMRGGGWLTILDLLFAAIVVWMLLGRWVEYRGGSAMTIGGNPVSPAQLSRYWVGLPVGAAAIWVVANALGNHVLA
ncbi:MAG: hypothetical protein H6816_14465 [Phycisphaerales bacterium]|nr:hypothetical protein [Phycisphaerales bacterium]